MVGPLEGVKVIDLSRALAGPYCSMMLGDLGAHIIKVEMPGRGDEARGWGPPFVTEDSAYFMSVNRNKRSITLDLRKQGAKEVLLRLIREGDVFLENFSPGTIGRLGFDYQRVREVNPRIIFCSISGFGQTGPGHNKPAYDHVLQGMGGMMSITGPLGGPPTKVGVALADIVGGMFAAYAIVSALYHRQRTGQGQMIDIPLIAGQVALLTFQAERYLTHGEVAVPLGNQHPLLAPSETFRTADGYVNIVAGNDILWQRFCQAIGRPELAEDPRFVHNADRMANHNEMAQLVEEALASMTTQQVIDVLEQAEVPVGSIRNIREVFEDPQVKHLGLRRRVHHPKAGELEVPGLPYLFSETPGSVTRHPPVLGEHTTEVLQELGFGPQDIASLRQEGAI